MSQPIFTYEFTRPLDDEAEPEEIEDRFNSQLDGVLREHPNLASVACIAVCTGYTDRLVTSPQLLEVLQPAVVYTDKIWDPELDPVIINPRAHVLCSQISDDGVCVFTDSDASKVFHYVECLGEADYCGFCNVQNVMGLEWHEVDGQLVLMCTVDTESG